MRADRFLEELPRLFDEFPRSEHPLDRRFQRVVDEVENLASENVLALINLAASLVEPDEAYVEIGVFHGASLIAAMLGNEGRRFVGVDAFRFRDASLDDSRRRRVELDEALRQLELAQGGERLGVGGEHLGPEAPLAIGDLRFDGRELRLGERDPAPALAGDLERDGEPNRRLPLPGTAS